MTVAAVEVPASARIDELIAEQDDWRGQLLAQLRVVIRSAAPEVVEDLKWAKPTNPTGVPAWSQAGLICTGELYKDKVKLTFFEGAALPDPSGLFNASVGAGTRRAIDFGPGDRVDAAALSALVRAAVGHNEAKAAATAAAKRRR